MTDRTIIGSATPIDLNSGHLTNTNNIEEIKTPDRPSSIALITSIEDAIEDIAPDNMTAIEVLGVLDVVAKRFYDDKLSLIKVAIEDAGL